MKHSKIIIASIFILALQVNSLAQKAKDFPANPKVIKKNSSQITDLLYASKVEVTNKNYSYFILDLQQNSETKKLKTAIIDSNQWVGDFYNLPYVKHYHTHKAYGAYPVVNISYEGAVLYCEWLTKKYNSNPKRKFQKVIFRLPTEKEWVNAAKAGNKKAIYPWDGDSMRTENGSYRANFRRSDKPDSNSTEENSINISILTPVYAYWPNELDIYNMSGNAAEMIQEKGTSKGGGFLDYEEGMKIASKGEYSLTSTGQVTLGFRWFMEILEH